MTIPNVTMKWCARKSKCKWCEQEVEVGQPIVSVFYWNKGNEESRKWNSQKMYHPQCWIDQGLDYLKHNPFVPIIKSHKIRLSPEDNRKRFLLIRRFHALEQRKQKIKTPYPDRLLIEQRLEKQMLDIMLEVAAVGGVPKHWVDKII